MRNFLPSSINLDSQKYSKPELYGNFYSFFLFFHQKYEKTEEILPKITENCIINSCNSSKGLEIFKIARKLHLYFKLPQKNTIL
jgi:hypothetical protein